MSNVIDKKNEDPKVLKMAGGLLFSLGLVAAALSKFTTTDPHMTLYAAVLLSMGYPMLLYVKSLGKIAVLEERIIQLEKRSSDS